MLYKAIFILHCNILYLIYIKKITHKVSTNIFPIDSNMEGVLQQKVIEVANQVEQQLDAELEKLDNLDINDYEKIRAHRLNELKRMQKQQQDWLASVIYHIYSYTFCQYDFLIFTNITFNDCQFITLLYQSDDFYFSNLCFYVKISIECIFIKI